VRELRGNVDTRLGKLAGGGYDALVLAAAGLERLERSDEGAPLDSAAFVPAAGQGCLVLEARADDARVSELAAGITDSEALVRLTAERAVVAALDATCHTPVAAHAVLDANSLSMDAFAGLPDGSAWVRDSLEGDPRDPAGLGRAVAERMLAAGAGELLRQADALAL
jgi:hydroxymethylbilane synthase